MPVRVAKHGDQYCVEEPSGSVVDGGCHDSKQDAMDHAAAINANTQHKTLMLFKDSAGVWNWMGAVSNNFMDREEDILTSDAHRRFVEHIDSGHYKETFNKNAPDLWVWHVPIPIGYAETVAYWEKDDKGFLVAGGKGHKGEFYDKVFTGLAQAETKKPGSMGMSHGMPWDYLEIEKSDEPKEEGELSPNYITGYMSEEFTFLPVDSAANLGTAMGGIMVKSMPEIDEYKRQWFIDTFGDEVVSEFDSRLSELGKAAEEAGIPRKEISMANSTEKNEETVVEETLAEEVAEETTVEEEAVIEEEVKQEESEDDEEEEKKQEDEEEMEDEEEDDAEKQYVTASDLEEVVQEVIKGVTEPFAEVNASLATMRDELNEMRKELDTLKMNEDERVAEKVKETPAASLSAIIAQTIVGQDKAKLDYNKDRKLRKAEPEETEFTDIGSDATGIPSIDELLRKQRGRGGVVRATYKNGQ